MEAREMPEHRGVSESRSRSPARRRGKFEVFRSEKNSEFYFRLKASNGEIVHASQGYDSKEGALNGIKSVCENGHDESNFEKRESASKQDYFVLKAKNGKIIGHSQMYKSGEAGRDHGIQSVMRNASEAKFVDLVEDRRRSRSRSKPRSPAKPKSAAAGL